MDKVSQATEFFKPHRKDSRILVGFLTLAVALFGVLRLASEISEGDTFAIDKAVLIALRSAHDLAVPIGPGWIKPTMIAFTALGSAPILTVIALIAVGYLLAARKLATAGFVALSVGGGALLSGLIKSVMERPRPQIVPHLVHVSSPSFPSGHAMNSAIVYLTLAVLLARAETRRGVQVYLIGIAVALTLLVGFTRMYLGVHWPTDVLAGWTVGAIWAAICSLTAKRLQSRSKIERADETSPMPNAAA